MPFNFLTPMRIIRDAILGVGSPAPILVSEGANTMDVGRSVLIQTEPRTRLDAGTWGTMGVGLGYCIAAAVASPDRLVVAVEGDSGFGFSAMEVEVWTLSCENTSIYLFRYFHHCTVMDDSYHVLLQLFMNKHSVKLTLAVLLVRDSYCYGFLVETPV